MQLILFTSFLLAFLVLFFYSKKSKWLGYSSAVVVFGMFAYSCSFLSPITEGATFAERFTWVPQLGVNAQLYLDSLSLFFVLLITFFGSLILIYATSYMDGKRHLNRFFFYLVLFMASMLGLVMSDNIMLLYVFWEMTSVSSFFLISYNNHDSTARNAGLQALLVTNLGGLALLAGLVLLGNAAGSYNLSDIINTSLTDHAHYPAILTLIFIGCFTKSAQYPFHFWLPNAMAAPTPVSAFLHSATMVKAGVFLLMRLSPTLSGTPAWSNTLMLIGGFTAIFAAAIAFVQHDIKRILAYVTVSALGMLVAAIGVEDHSAMQAAFIYLLSHAIYKGALFMSAGNIDKINHTRDTRDLHSLMKYMPFTGAGVLLACLAMAGISPFFAFIAKEKLYESSMSVNVSNILVLISFFISSILYFALSIRLAYGLFFKRRKALPADKPAPKQKDTPFAMWFPSLCLGIIGLLLGVIPEYIGAYLNRITDTIIGYHMDLDLALWHGLNLTLGLTLITYAVGFLCYRYYDVFFNLINTLKKRNWLSSVRLYNYAIENIDPAAIKLTRIIQNGQLTKYLKVIFVFVILLVSYVYFKYDLLPQDWNFEQEIRFGRIYEFLPIVMIMSGVFMLLNGTSRLTMLVSLSLIGYGIALFYAMFSAPDVSMTQFLVETITLVIFTIILHKMPKNAQFPRDKRQILVVGIAVVFGALMTLVLSSLQGVEFTSVMKEFYIANSADRGKGENVVNVILVDFRAFDTFGELAVLCMTALGVMALIKLKTYKNNNL